MKKNHVLFVAIGVSLMAMSFTPKINLNDAVKAEKIQVKPLKDAVTANHSEAGITNTISTMVTVSVIYISVVEELLPISTLTCTLGGSENVISDDYKAMVQEIDFRNLETKK